MMNLEEQFLTLWVTKEIRFGLLIIFEKESFEIIFLLIGFEEDNPKLE